MSAAWRVEGDRDAGWKITEKGARGVIRIVAQFASEADARAAVAAHNAQGEAEPVAWQWRWKGTQQWSCYIDAATAENRTIDSTIETRPLFAAPPPPVDALAVVKRKRDEYAEGEKRWSGGVVCGWQREAADEIIRELEGGR